MPYTLVYADSSITNSTHTTVAENLMSEYLLMTKGIGNEELIGKYGEKWVNRTNSWLAKNKNNKAIVNSPLHTSLLKSTSLLTNYLAVKKHFDSCIKDKSNKRQLAKRTLTVILQNEKEANPCTPMLRGFSNFNDFYKENSRIMKKLIQPQYEKEIKKQVLTNSLLALYRFERKFHPTKFSAVNKEAKNDLSKLIEEACVPNSNNKQDQCLEYGTNFRSELQQKLQSITPEIFEEKKYSIKSAKEELNNKLGILNTAIKKVTVNIDKGIVYDSPKAINSENQQHFNNYVQSYLQMASHGAGAILFTEKIKDKAGGLRTVDNDLDKDIKKKVYKLEPHYVVAENDVSMAITEARNKIRKQIIDLPKEGVGFFGSKDHAKGIDQLSAANPFAIGMILAKNPEYAGLACDSFNRISSDDSFDEKLDKAFFVGTAVLSGALILTGVGTVAGAYLLTGSLSAGIAAGTVGGSILATTALVGTATELTSAAYYGSRAIEQSNELDRMEKAIFSNNGDQNSIKEATDTLVAFKEARLQLAIGLVGATGSLALGATKIPALIATKSLSIKELKIVNSILNSINNSATAIKIARAIKLWGKPIDDLFEQFILALSKVSESTRLKFLKTLENSKLTPEKLKEIIQDALNAAKNCP